MGWDDAHVHAYAEYGCMSMCVLAAGSFAMPPLSSWYMQIHVGHMLLEKRKAALTDSFFQSIVMAPLFVFYELLFAMGLCTELKDRLQKRIDAAIAEWKASQKKGQ